MRCFTALAKHQWNVLIFHYFMPCKSSKSTLWTLNSVHGPLVPQSNISSEAVCCLFNILWKFMPAVFFLTKTGSFIWLKVLSIWCPQPLIRHETRKLVLAWNKWDKISVLTNSPTMSDSDSYWKEKGVQFVVVDRNHRHWIMNMNMNNSS